MAIIFLPLNSLFKLQLHIYYDGKNILKPNPDKTGFLRIRGALYSSSSSKAEMKKITDRLLSISKSHNFIRNLRKHSANTKPRSRPTLLLLQQAVRKNTEEE